MKNKIKSFFNLIRFKNLFITSLIQIFIKFFLIDYYLENSALSNLHFTIYLFSLLSIIAAGYIINDIYDEEIDKINKPEKVFINKVISKSFALKSYYIINLIGVFGGIYITHQVNKLWLGVIFIFFAFSLFQYSKSYKKMFIIGNIQVAFLTALSIITLALIELLHIEVDNPHSIKIIFQIILYYSGFAFIITLIREIIKDLEDLEGDKKLNANTLAINIGLKKSKFIIISLILTSITLIAYFQYFQYSVISTTFSIELNYWGVNLIAIIYTILIQLLLIHLVLKVNLSTTKFHFQHTSSLCKIIMLVGICSIPLFSLLT